MALNSRNKWGDKNSILKYLTIEVVDTGIGMNAQDQKELFTKFGTMKTTLNLNRNGLGLGLYLSREIWLKLGGDITWDSMVGIDSIFTIKLPLSSKEDLNDFFEIKEESKYDFDNNLDSPLETDLEFDEFSTTSENINLRNLDDIYQ